MIPRRLQMNTSQRCRMHNLLAFVSTWPFSLHKKEKYIRLVCKVYTLTQFVRATQKHVRLLVNSGLPKSTQRSQYRERTFPCHVHWLNIYTHTSCGHFDENDFKRGRRIIHGSHETKHSMPPLLCYGFKAIGDWSTTTFTYHCLFLRMVRGDIKLINFITTPHFCFYGDEGYRIGLWEWMISYMYCSFWSG